MRVAITGYALSSPFGRTPEAFWRGITEGPVPATERTSPAFPDVRCLAALLPLDVPGGGRAAAPVRARALADDLVARALASAGLHSAPPGSGLALGTHFGESDFLALPLPAAPPSLISEVAARAGLRGPVANTPSGCAAGNLSLAWARDCLESGQAPLMVAGGLDVVGDFMVGGFEMFGAMAEELPRPFSRHRDGFMLGEGGALFVLEPLEQARAAHRRVYAELLSTGLGHDAFHTARPSPDGRGLIGSLRRALAEAQLSPGDVDYVNAHSPGTWANDVGEAEAYREVFGARGVAVSSTKAALGHAQGGANGLEAAACLLALEHQAIPPTLGLTDPDDALALDLVMGPPRPAALRRVLSAAAGMGGACAVVLLGQGDPWAS